MCLPDFSSCCTRKKISFEPTLSDGRTDGRTFYHNPFYVRLGEMASPKKSTDSPNLKKRCQPCRFSSHSTPLFHFLFSFAHICRLRRDDPLPSFVRAAFARRIPSQGVMSATHERGCETIVLVRCIQCHIVDMTLDAPKISY